MINYIQYEQADARQADWVIVGSGLTGCTAARKLAEVGARVFVVEKRLHVGGNVYEEKWNDGTKHSKSRATIPAYGPHIFHTNSDDVFSFLSRFTSWRDYEHRVDTHAENSEINVPLPVNFNTIDKLFDKDLAEAIIGRLRVVGERLGTDEVSLVKLLGQPDDDTLVRWFAKHVYGRFFLNYTKRMWGGRRPEDLSPSVTGRVPVRLNRDDRYFRDIYQKQPLNGFNSLIEKMLEHENISVAINVKNTREMPSGRVGLLWTGPIDEYFKMSKGQLPYRSLTFDVSETWPLGRQLGYVAATRNNTESVGNWTRRTLCGKLYSEEGNTRVLREYPADYVAGENEPYYPIPCAESEQLYNSYLDVACEVADNGVFFAGRLGRYQYLNMDQAVASALATFQKELLPWHRKKLAELSS